MASCVFMHVQKAYRFPLCFLPSTVNPRVLVQCVVSVIALASLTANVPHFKRVVPERSPFVVR